jgi:hypothetical protein
MQERKRKESMRDRDRLSKREKGGERVRREGGKLLSTE